MTRLEKQLYLACRAGYLLALQMPHDSLRARNQATFCELRNAIAACDELEQETVQNDFESRAFLLAQAEKP